MQRAEITEKIGKINIKIAIANKELEELELKCKKKKLEVRKYKNESARLQLELQELDIENYKKIQQEKNINRLQKETIRKYADPNNEYYSQEKSYYNLENLYKSYIKKKDYHITIRKEYSNMDYDDLKDILMKKVEQELYNYKQNLIKNYTPEQIINEAYEINFKEQIRDILDSSMLGRQKIKVLLKTDNILGELYDYWKHSNGNIWGQLEDRVEEKITKMTVLDYKKNREVR